MLVKLDAKTSRAKSLAFHPKRPWILAALHSGAVQLWDYRMGTMLEEYHEHEGPARGCAFHPTQPIFASCGDDYTVRVYNYRTKRCLFTLTGHMDYVRSVQFHPDAPWLMSASDDQTVRVWNWQSRQCMSVLTGHSHYVMCAQFHPKEDLVVSASLDQTVRVWDISGLRRKGTSASASPVGAGGNAYPASMSPRTSGQLDLFAPPDGAVKYILEGHERGVNWVAFHPTKPLIASGSDDRTVRIWRFNDIRAWEVDCLRGHQNNVSAVAFHPKLELLFSDSEDKTMKVWDISGLNGSPAASHHPSSAKKVQTVRRDERYWSLAAHPESNLMAFGHDDGFAVFKMEPERPPFVVSENTVFYFNDKVLKAFPLSGTGKSHSLMTADHRIALPATLAHNPAEEAVLLSMNCHGGKYELYCLRSGQVKHGQGAFGVFTAKNRFAVLDQSANTVNVMSMDNTVYRSLPVEAFPVQRLLPATTGTVLIVGEERVLLFDLHQGRSIFEWNISGVKWVSWSADNQRLALIAKKSIHIIDRQSGSVCAVVEEPNQVKSVVWSDALMFYTNAHHLKYVLPNGDSGVVCTVDRPYYLLRVQDESVFVIDRQGQLQVITIDPTEHAFKLALQRHDLQRVSEIIETSPLVGQAIITFLRKNGYAQVALRFVQDAGSRFELAVEAGRLDIALFEADRLNSKECWLRLGEEAVLLGDVEVAEAAYRGGGWGEKLSFLYLVTGQFEKLKRAAVNGSQSVHNQVLLGDWRSLCEALSGSCPSLATHCVSGRVDGPPKVNAITNSWPLSEPLPDAAHYEPVRSESATLEYTSDIDKHGDQKVRPVEAPPVLESGGWGDDDDLIITESDEDLPLLVDNHDDGTLEISGFAQTLPGPGKPLFPIPSDTPRNCIANGDFEKCKQMLADDYGVCHFDALVPTIERVIMSSRLYHQDGSVPFVLVGEECDCAVSDLLATLEQSMALLTSGHFKEAQSMLLDTFYMSFFVNHRGVSGEVRRECGEYLSALQVELTRRDLPADDHRRHLELSSFFTHFTLRLEHHRLSLRSAMTAAYKQRCNRLAGKLARRLLDTATADSPLPEAVLVMAKKVLAQGEKGKEDDPIAVEYDGLRAVVVCMKRVVQINQPLVRCPCCSACYGEHAGVCCVCHLANI